MSPSTDPKLHLSINFSTGIDACKRDSGGPLTWQDSQGKWNVIGVVSWGEGKISLSHINADKFLMYNINE